MAAFGPSQRIVLGEVTGAHGLKGELRVRIAGDAPDHLMTSEAVWLARSPQDPEARRFEGVESDVTGDAQDNAWVGGFWVNLKKIIFRND